MAGVWLGEIPFYCCLPVGLTLPGSFNHVPTFIFFPVRTTKSTSVSIDSESTTSQCYSQSFQYLIAGGLWRTGRPLNQSAERSNTLIIDGLNFALFEQYSTLDHYNLESFSWAQSLVLFSARSISQWSSELERGLLVILRHARTSLAAMINRSQPQNAALFLCLACIATLRARTSFDVLCYVPLHNVCRVTGSPMSKLWYFLSN